MFSPYNAMKTTNSKTVISVTLGQDEGPPYLTSLLPSITTTVAHWYKVSGMQSSIKQLSQGNTHSLSQ